MEFLQVPETPAPEPTEVLEMQEDCPEAQIGIEYFLSFAVVFMFLSFFFKILMSKLISAYIKQEPEVGHCCQKWSYCLVCKAAWQAHRVLWFIRQYPMR